MIRTLRFLLAAVRGRSRSSSLLVVAAAASNSAGVRGKTQRRLGTTPGQEGRHAHAARLLRRRLRRPGPHVLHVRRLDGGAGDQPPAVLLQARRANERRAGSRRRRAPGLRRQEDRHGQDQEGRQVRARRSTARSRSRTSSTPSSASSRPNVGGQYPGYFHVIQGAPRSPAGGAQAISGITTPTTDTIVFKLTEGRTASPSSPRWSCRSRRRCPRSTPSRSTPRTPSTYNTHVVSTGPYMIQNDARAALIGYKPGKSIYLVRNPNWNTTTDYRPAYVDEIIRHQRDRRQRRRRAR